jgi:hypothetical protein
MYLSNPDTSLKLFRGCDERSQQAAEQRAHVVAPVEAELHLGELAMAYLANLMAW